jgi:hypothetical protein
MTPKEILIAARAKIEAPERWTQGNEARDANGNPVGPNSVYAVRWCSAAALNASEANYDEWLAARNLLLRAFGKKYGTITRHNDTSTHAEVRSAFDRAIAAAGDA